MRKDSIVLTTSRSNDNRHVSGTVVSHQDIDLSEHSEDRPIYAFQSCTFSNLINSGDGGAITCSASSNSYWEPQLFIKECSFSSCKSSSGNGGAIYADKTSSFVVEKTSFAKCNSTNMRGGGIYFTSSAGFPLLSDTTFISCYAQNSPNSDTIDDGGGILISLSTVSTELHYIIQACRFISCGSYDWGGGSYIYSPSAKLGCTNSLFSSCTSRTAEGIGIDVRTAYADVLIHFCYFSCSTSPTTPTDISINRNAESSSSPSLHSFSTKAPPNSVKIWVNWSDKGYRNWFIQ